MPQRADPSAPSILLDLKAKGGKHIELAMPRGRPVGSWGSALIPRVAVPAEWWEINRQHHGQPLQELRFGFLKQMG